MNRKYRVIFFVVLYAGFSILFMKETAFAFSCPRLIKAASESIARAEASAVKVTDEREKGRAKAMIELAKQWNKEADADHQEAGAKKDAQLHYRAEAKAKAAQVLAEMVQ